jgi:hypothetical protein
VRLKGREIFVSAIMYDKHKILGEWLWPTMNKIVEGGCKVEIDW